MKYDRFVYIISRDGVIKGVLSSSTAARKALKAMRDSSVPEYDPTKSVHEYLVEVATEEIKWTMVKWKIGETFMIRKTQD